MIDDSDASKRIFAEIDEAMECETLELQESDDWMAATYASIQPGTYRPLTETELEACRTYIEPGADPRARWDDGEHPRNTRGLSADEDDAGYSPRWAKAYRKARLRYPRNERRSLFEQNDGPNGGLSWASETYADGARYRALRYVPRDVARWRDPEHRAELTRRAREYAALQPHGWRR